MRLYVCMRECVFYLFIVTCMREGECLRVCLFTCVFVCTCVCVRVCMRSCVCVGA